MTSREVTLDGGSPWGFRIQGGSDCSHALRISRVNPGSKASVKGVREGDLITSINGQSTRDVTNVEAHALLKTAGDSLHLGLNEDSNGGSPKRRQYRTVVQECHSETTKESTVTSYSITSSETITSSDQQNETGSPSQQIASQPSTISSDCSTRPLSEESEPSSVWSPGQKATSEAEPQEPQTLGQQEEEEESTPSVWTPKSATSSPIVERKEFRPVNFRSPVLERKNRGAAEPPPPPWQQTTTSETTRLTSSQSLPASGFRLQELGVGPRLPKVQNPTITLLQQAREGHLPKGPHYLNSGPTSKNLPNKEKPATVGPGEVVFRLKSEYTSDSDGENPRKMADLAAKKYEGVGPTAKNGMPLTLRSEVQENNHTKWYKKMYDTIHKQPPTSDEFVTVRYKQKKGPYAYNSYNCGYLSEPEAGSYDSDLGGEYNKYATLDRRRQPFSDVGYHTSTMPRPITTKPTDLVRNQQYTYRNHPGKIENYTPGRSSISEKEAKQHLEQQKRAPPQTRSFINQALKESGYESDSTLVFRRKGEAPLSPNEQKVAYKVIQKGGEVPLHGLRKNLPDKPKESEPPPPPPKQSPAKVAAGSASPESPRKYVENQVTIHYKTPVRQEVKECLSEDELAYRQAEAMKKIYEEERRRKYLQELQDMTSRRHTDNFIPSQKSPISLNRYDDFEALPARAPPPTTSGPGLLARALYNFVGQTARELTFRKGDLIHVRKQVDKNWYEGEFNAMVGLFPVNYVEIIHHDSVRPAASATTQRKSHEGQARAKFKFVAQTHLELSLAKGEIVVITRKVDDNWFEGKIGGRKGIFPISYVEVLIDPKDPPPASNKPVAAPAAHSLLHNGSASGKESMGSHLYTPAAPPSSSYHAKPVQLSGLGTYGSLGRVLKNPMAQTLHIDTQSDPVPYRALYKYNPQNDDELELLEGDLAFVIEKCDDGWYVGSNERTGAFGTFPGNYVEKI